MSGSQLFYTRLPKHQQPSTEQRPSAEVPATRGGRPTPPRMPLVFCTYDRKKKLIYISSDWINYWHINPNKIDQFSEKKEHFCSALTCHRSNHYLKHLFYCLCLVTVLILLTFLLAYWFLSTILFILFYYYYIWFICLYNFKYSLMANCIPCLNLNSVKCLWEIYKYSITLYIILIVMHSRRYTVFI